LKSKRPESAGRNNGNKSTVKLNSNFKLKLKSNLKVKLNFKLNSNLNRNCKSKLKLKSNCNFNVKARALPRCVRSRPTNER
jgi:hypothetical protein